MTNEIEEEAEEKSIKLKVKPHPFPEFSGKFMVGNSFGAYCGNFGFFKVNGTMSAIDCPKVFSGQFGAEKFIKQELGEGVI